MSTDGTTGPIGGPTDIARLLEIMARLRDPEGGCPWDVAQDFASVAPYTIEEAYEVADAIARDDRDALVDELGDLLLQVVFHAQMAREAAMFAFDDVVAAICDKMVRRHPHVFGDVEISDVATQSTAWEAHKAAERAAAGSEDAPASALDGVAQALPALMRAAKLQRRAARVGFDWKSIAPVLAKVDEEIAELRAEIAPPGDAAPSPAGLRDEIGDLLFACVNVARHLDIDPEDALRGANAKFERRFRQVEAALARAGRRPGQASLDEMDELWRRAKLTE
jgi:nucleoside triphosphate diphosphatase